MNAKARINLAVNILSYSLSLGLVVTGSVLKWVLPPGSGRVNMGGRGGGARNIDVVLGLTRHEWGDIHFWIAVVFVFSLSLHFFLHWPWIRAMVWGTSLKPLSLRRRLLTIGVGILSVGILCLPLVVSKQRVTQGELRSQRIAP